MWRIFKWNWKRRKKHNEEIYRNFFKYQNPSSLVEELIREDKNKTDKIKFQIMNELIKMEDINKKRFLKMKTQKKELICWKNP